MAATRSNEVGGSDYTSGANREDLANFISLVSADKTPFISSIRTNKATNAKHEWNTQSLRDAKNNAQSTSFSFDTANNVSQTTTRIANYVQTFGETVHIDGLQMKSMSVGAAKDWFENTVNIRKVELRRDIERKALLYKNFTVDGDVIYDSGNTPKMAGLAAYAGIINSPATASVEVNAGSGTGTPITGVTAGTAFSVLGTTNAAQGSHVVQAQAAVTNVSLSLAHLNSTFQTVSENGGNINMAMVPTGLKAAVSDLLIAGNGGAAQRRASEMAKRLNLAVDSVLTEFGYDITIAHNYIMQNQSADASSSVYLYNTDSINRTVMQPYTLEMDQTARFGKAGILFCAETLEVQAPNELALIFGVTA